ncbi:hypothetical protein N9L47_05170 [Rhodobacteraceae bacterium]|nr:hypothetical protein [Paracoccaceae bacterium]
MQRLLLIAAFSLASPAFAQELVDEPNGTVTGVFLGKEIAIDVLCETSPLFADAAGITSHTPLSQSLIDDVKEDAIQINMFNNGASFLANIDGEIYIKADRKFGFPDFPVSVSNDDFDILISCPADF